MWCPAWHSLIWRVVERFSLDLGVGFSRELRRFEGLDLCILLFFLFLILWMAQY